MSDYQYRKISGYCSYRGAKSRCSHSSHPSFHRYGGRGIEFRFDSFEEFLKELGERPSDKHTLERIDNNGHYESGNVRWATMKEQSRNTVTNRKLTVKGVEKVISEWAEIYGCPTARIATRLLYRWCVECAVELPLGESCPHRSPLPKTAKVTRKQAVNVRQMFQQGMPYAQIAKQLNISYRCVMRICNNQTFK